MSNIPEQLFEQVSNLPDSGRFLIVTPVIAALTVRSWIKDNKGSASTKDELVSHYGNHDDNLLDHVISTSKTNNPATLRAYDSRQRLLPRRLMTIGSAILLASGITQPTTEIVSTNNLPSSAVALDSSLAMQNTPDMKGHVTRYNAAVSGLEQSSISGNLALVDFGANTSLSIPMSAKNNTQIENSRSNSSVNQNGADVVAGLSLAASELPTSSSNSSKKSGQVILISDGVFGSSSNPSQISQEVTSLQEQGIETKVIVTGNNPASYNYGGTIFSSSAQQNTFSSFGSKNIYNATSAEEIAKAINSDQQAVGQTKQKQVWYPPYILGAALAFVGYRKYGRKIRKVTV
jgi:hypothetical protein